METIKVTEHKTSLDWYKCISTCFRPDEFYNKPYNNLDIRINLKAHGGTVSEYWEYEYTNYDGSGRGYIITSRIELREGVYFVNIDDDCITTHKERSLEKAISHMGNRIFVNHVKYIKV